MKMKLFYTNPYISGMKKKDKYKKLGNRFEYKKPHFYQFFNAKFEFEQTRELPL